MTTGTVGGYDPVHRKGYIISDSDVDNERIPFELEKNAPPVKEGDRVRFHVEGGMAGILAVEVRPL